MFHRPSLSLVEIALRTRATYLRRTAIKFLIAQQSDVVREEIGSIKVNYLFGK